MTDRWIAKAAAKVKKRPNLKMFPIRIAVGKPIGKKICGKMRLNSRRSYRSRKCSQKKCHKA